MCHPERICVSGSCSCCGEVRSEQCSRSDGPVHGPLRGRGESASRDRGVRVSGNSRRPCAAPRRNRPWSERAGPVRTRWSAVGLTATCAMSESWSSRPRRRRRMRHRGRGKRCWAEQCNGGGKRKPHAAETGLLRSREDPLEGSVRVGHPIVAGPGPPRPAGRGAALRALRRPVPLRPPVERPGGAGGDPLRALPDPGGGPTGRTGYRRLASPRGPTPPMVRNGRERGEGHAP